MGRLLLALVALRALVPAGFMLGSAGGRVSVVLCEPGVIAMAPGMPMPDGTAMPAGMTMPGDTPMPPPAHAHHGVAPATEHPSDCPYAQSAGPALQPPIPWLGGHPPCAVRRSPPVLAQVIARSRPSSQHSPRGPPTPLDSLI